MSETCFAKFSSVQIPFHESRECCSFKGFIAPCRCHSASFCFRNLFFRILHLLQLGVRLVFVIEGSAPELKWNTMMKRQQTRFPGRQSKPQNQKPERQNRRNFNNCLKEVNFPASVFINLISEDVVEYMNMLSTLLILVLKKVPLWVMPYYFMSYMNVKMSFYCLNSF